MVTIAYDGGNILNTSSEGNYTLAANGKVMASNLVATVDSASKLSASYNGNTILNEATNGTYTFQTNGKVMASDIVAAIAAVATDYTVAISLTNPMGSGFVSGVIMGLTSSESTTISVPITSTTYSGTVVFPANTSTIRIQLTSDERTYIGTYTVTGGIVYRTKRDSYQVAYIEFSVSGNGTINLDGNNYRD